MPLSLAKQKANEKSRRELIVNTALELFDFNGFDETTIQDIAKKANISKGLVYHYYSSKQEILLAFNKLIDHCEHEINSLPTAQEKINLYLKRTLWDYRDNHYHSPLRIMLWAQIEAPSNVVYRDKDLFNGYGIRFFEPIIKEGQAEGSIRKGDPQEMAAWLWHCIIGYIVQRVKYENHDTKAAAHIIWHNLQP